GSRHTRRHRLPTPKLGRRRPATRPARKVVLKRGGAAGEPPSSRVVARGKGGTDVPRAPRRQMHVPARRSVTAGKGPARPAGGPAVRSVVRADTSGRAQPPLGPRVARGLCHGWRGS